MKIDHHKYRVFWSDEDQEYVGTCDEFPSLSWLAKTPRHALRGIRRVVNDGDVINECNLLSTAKEIISRWPGWKQAMGLSSLKNDDNAPKKVYCVTCQHLGAGVCTADDNCKGSWHSKYENTIESPIEKNANNDCKDYLYDNGGSRMI